MLFVFIIFWTFRLFYFFGTNIPLGYDAWIYIFLFQDYTQVLSKWDFSVLANRNQHEPLVGIVANLFNFLGFSFDWIVRWWVWFLSLLPGIIIFLIFWKKDKLLAVFSSGLYFLSIPQYEAFFWWYLKQIIWVSFMLVSILFLTYKKYFLFAFFLFLLILLHRHTALFTIVLGFAWIVFDSIKSKKIPYIVLLYILFVWVLSLIFYLPLREKLVLGWLEPLLSTFAGKWVGGIFIDKFKYLQISGIVFGLSLFQVFFDIKNKKLDFIFFGRIISVGRILFGLINYNRHLVFLDIFVIIMAGKILSYFWQQKHKIYFWIIILLLIGLSFQYFSYVLKHNKPIISQNEFDVINSFAEFLPEDAILMTSHRNYTPRIMGYGGKDRISPGRSDLDMWPKEERITWRKSNWDTKCKMLFSTYNQLGRPIYRRVWEKQFQENTLNWKCFNLVDGWETRELFKIVF